jgi:hypothetical protein
MKTEKEILVLFNPLKHDREIYTYSTISTLIEGKLGEEADGFMR